MWITESAVLSSFSNLQLSLNTRSIHFVLIIKFFQFAIEPQHQVSDLEWSYKSIVHHPIKWSISRCGGQFLSINFHTPTSCVFLIFTASRFHLSTGRFYEENFQPGPETRGGVGIWNFGTVKNHDKTLRATSWAQYTYLLYRKGLNCLSDMSTFD